ncbi:MAG: tRNA (adenosine(37)-N6)-threonylcarbamoyltransferase complex dimerization subunit type 1 TsaB [Planctomycetaceae bacterium]
MVAKRSPPSISRSGRRHARTLVSELAAMFDSAGLRPADCQCVAVSIGPGSFTGLRVGVVCAKTFAYATGCQVVAVETLHAIAAAAPQDVDKVDTLVDAQRGEVFRARFHRQHGGQWTRDGAIIIEPWEAVIASVARGDRFAGPALEHRPDEFPEFALCPASYWEPRAAIVACLGEQAALNGEVDDLYKLEPLYIRRSAAEEQRERRAQATVPGDGV